MAQNDSTCWDVIQGAARHNDVDRDTFARRYGPVVRAYLSARWESSPLRHEIEDAESAVFLECFRAGGVLDRVDAARSGGFRAFLYGVVRNVARRFEVSRHRSREQPHSTAFDADDRAASDTSLSHVLDRSWARAVVDAAGRRYRQQAERAGEEALRRCETLRLRFQESLPIRDIARLWKMDPSVVHQHYRRARLEFRRCLEAELAFEGGLTGVDNKREWSEFLALLR